LENGIDYAVQGVVFCLLEQAELKEYSMKKYLVAAALIVGFSVPAFAVETFYIMYDNSMKGCSVMTEQPTGTQYKMMGKYNTKAEADAAMKTMKECAAG
jgi:hypothetical protein